VALAQRDLDNTVLYAPVAGTVGAINGVVNEYVGAETGLTSQLPVPAPPSRAWVRRPPSSQKHDQHLDETAPVTAARSITLTTSTPSGGRAVRGVRRREKSPRTLPVEVTFDAIPDLLRDGRSVALAPGGTDIAGVTNYYAPSLLTDTEPRLKDGQTARVGVLTSSKDNVLVVPNNAVLRTGGRTFVSVPGPDGKPHECPIPGPAWQTRTRPRWSQACARASRSC